MAAQSGVSVGELEHISGVTLAFIAFPQIISMMPGGPVFGVLFFGSLALAGLTSLLSILQVVSAAFQEKFGLSPRQGALRVGGIAAVLSIALYSTTTALPLLDTMDKYVNEVGIVGSAVLMVLVVWRTGRLRELQRHLNNRTGVRLGAWWRVLVMLVAPVVLGYMLISGAWTLIVEGYGEPPYPRWFTNTFGWGMVAALVVVAVVMAGLRWRRSPDDFVPEELPAEAVRVGTGSRRGGEGR